MSASAEPALKSRLGRPEDPPVPLVCPSCGSAFISVYRQTKFCSSKCRMQAYWTRRVLARLTTAHPTMSRQRTDSSTD